MRILGGPELPFAQLAGGSFTSPAEPRQIYVSQSHRGGLIALSPFQLYLGFLGVYSSQPLPTVSGLLMEKASVSRSCWTCVNSQCSAP